MALHDDKINAMAYSSNSGVLTATTQGGTDDPETIRVQSDWTEVDPEERSFIKKRPTVNVVTTLAARNAMSTIPSGSIVKVISNDTAYIRDAVNGVWIEVDNAPNKNAVGIPMHVVGNTYQPSELIHVGGIFYNSTTTTTSTPPNADWNNVTIADFFC